MPLCQDSCMLTSPELWTELIPFYKLRNCGLGRGKDSPVGPAQPRLRLFSSPSFLCIHRCTAPKQSRLVGAMPEKGQALRLGLGLGLGARPYGTKGATQGRGLARSGRGGKGPRVCALSPMASLVPGGELAPVLLA